VCVVDVVMGDDVVVFLFDIVVVFGFVELLCYEWVGDVVIIIKML